MGTLRLLLLLLSSSAFAQAPAQDPAVHFVQTYNTWIELHQSYNPNVLNSRELKAWNDTKTAWRDLQRVADALY